MTSPNDSDLRRLFDDAVADVHPEGGPEQIRARGGRPSAKRWVPVTLAAAAATAIVIGGGTWLAQHQSSNPPAAGPGPDKAPASQAPATRTVTVPVYYVGDTASGPRLFVESHRVENATGSDVEVAVNQAIVGRPQDKDYQKWPLAGGFRGPSLSAAVNVGADAITVDFREPGDTHDLVGFQAGRQIGQVSLQAVAWTATQAAGKDLPVAFTYEGKPLPDIGGIKTANPVQRASEDSVLSPVLIDSPAQGATVPTRFTVEGRAATFEANVVWELKRGDAIVRNGFTTAQECCTLAPYSFTVTAPPGDYTLVVHDTDESDGEGVGTSQDTKDITVK